VAYKVLVNGETLTPKHMRDFNSAVLLQRRYKLITNVTTLMHAQLNTCHKEQDTCIFVCVLMLCTQVKTMFLIVLCMSVYLHRARLKS
jgi:hypothetical protein